MPSYYSARYIRLSLENEAVQLVVIRHAKTYANSRMNIKVSQIHRAISGVGRDLAVEEERQNLAKFLLSRDTQSATYLYPFPCRVNL